MYDLTLPAYDMDAMDRSLIGLLIYDCFTNVELVINMSAITRMSGFRVQFGQNKHD